MPAHVAHQQQSQPGQQSSWQHLASHCITELKELCTLLELNYEEISALCVSNHFALRVPMPFVARMQKGNAKDPLLLQVLPLKQEQQAAADYVSDPLDEMAFNPVSGLIHKYAGRVLLTAATSCPINCRYCFRRHFPYTENRLTPSTWQPALDYIRRDTTITEVILSGGEPLLLNDAMLDKLLSSLESIQHLKLLRIHTRLPIVIPQRVTRTLRERLLKSKLRTSIVLHCNHAQEIDGDVRTALAPLVASPVTLLNQSVLLKGINDNADTLQKLSFSLFEAGVLPYYLHATDLVAGTAHFTVDDKSAKVIHKQLLDLLPGYLVPTLVREISHEKAKTRLAL